MTFQAWKQMRDPENKVGLENEILKFHDFPGFP